MKTIIWQDGYGDGIFGIGDDLAGAVADANNTPGVELTADGCTQWGGRSHDGAMVYANVPDGVAAIAANGGFSFLAMIQQ